MLRMTDNNNAGGCPNENEFISIDQKKRQITFIEASSSSTGVGVGAAGIENANIAAAASEAGPSNAAILDRAPMVSAPKIFAFDGLFTNADPQVSILWRGRQAHFSFPNRLFKSQFAILGGRQRQRPTQQQSNANRTTCAQRRSRTSSPRYWTGLMDAFWPWATRNPVSIY